jgi:hypothetical protein
MGSYRQTFLYNFPALVTLLASETWVHSHGLMTSSCSLIFPYFSPTPVSATPRIKYFWVKKKMITIGKIVKTETAIN